MSQTTEHHGSPRHGVMHHVTPHMPRGSLELHQHSPLAVNKSTVNVILGWFIQSLSTSHIQRQFISKSLNFQDSNDLIPAFENLSLSLKSLKKLQDKDLKRYECCVLFFLCHTHPSTMCLYALCHMMLWSSDKTNQMKRVCTCFTVAAQFRKVQRRRKHNSHLIGQDTKLNLAKPEFSSVLGEIYSTRNQMSLSKPQKFNLLFNPPCWSAEP